MSDKREKGSITVEAALFIPLFFFTFMCIFSLISCVRAQVLIQYSVDQAAKEVAEYSYILEKTGVLDAYKGLNSRSEEFQKQMQDIKSNLEVIEDTAKRVSNGQGTIQNVVEAGKAGKATADQLKEYKENPKEFVNGVLDYLKNTGWNKLAGYMTGVVGKACLKKQLSIASGGQDADEYLEKLGVTNMKFSKSSWCAGGSKKVQGRYEMLLKKLGAEFSILREVPQEDIRTVGGEALAEGIRRLRAGEVVRKPGFDGEYGKIELF